MERVNLLSSDGSTRTYLRCTTEERFESLFALQERGFRICIAESKTGRQTWYSRKIQEGTSRKFKFVKTIFGSEDREVRLYEEFYPDLNQPEDPNHHVY